MAALLGIPFETTNQAALLPVAHPVGERFGPARRRGVDEVLRIDGWQTR